MSSVSVSNNVSWKIYLRSKVNKKNKIVLHGSLGHALSVVNMFLLQGYGFAYVEKILHLVRLARSKVSVRIPQVMPVLVYKSSYKEVMNIYV